MNGVRVKVFEKQPNKIREVIEFDGDDAFFLLYKYIAEKYGFNGHKEKK